MVPGPYAASQRCSSSTRAAAGSNAAGCGRAPGPSCNQAAAGAHRYWLESHDPRGRARTIRPSVASRNSTRVEMPTVPAHVRPAPKLSFRANSGTSSVSSLAVASPRAASASRVRRSTPASQPAASPPAPAMPCSLSNRSSRRRSGGARARVQAASTTAASAGGSTNKVRRMPSTRTSERAR